MEIIAEVEPTRSREKLESWIPPLRGLVDWIDVPESPLGVARAHSVAVAHYVEETYGIPAIAHLRTYDVNLVALRSLVGAAVLLGLKRIVLLRGDPPRSGAPCSSGLDPEAGIVEARTHGLGRLSVGLLLSARKSRSDIQRRLRSGPDFVFVLNAALPRLREIASEARRAGVRVYPYLIVETERNRYITSGMPDYTPRYKVREVLDVVKSLPGLVDGVILSVPGDYESLAIIAERLRHTI